MKKMLVVEDESIIAMELEEHLTGMGYEVAGRASSGVEAIAKARDLRPDLILMDIVMPGEKDGIEASKEIKSEMDVPVIFVTAYADEEFIKRAKMVGPFGYIVKPYEDRELRAGIEIALYKKEMERQLQKAHDGLERRVKERTAELMKANEQLKQEIEERNRAEDKIKASLEEKEVLLREIHHRVKNNLQIISSLLNLQSESVEDEYTSELFKISQTRINSMALIHEELYRSKDLARIDFADYIQKLVTELYSSYGVNFETIKQNINVGNISLDIDKAIPCGLIINELVSNSFKHAFPEGKEGEIRIALRSDNNQRTLTISDNGVGFPKDMDFRNTDTLGMQLVCTLTNQLDGTIELDRSGGGTTFNITFTAYV